MAHNRKLVLSAVALVKVRLNAKAVAAAGNRVRDELEQEIIESGFLEGAPFKWVGLIIREGLVDETKPHFQRINQRHGDLPLAIEIDTHRLLGASEDEVAAVYRKATLLALVAAGERYKLPTERLRLLLSTMEA